MKAAYLLAGMEPGPLLRLMRRNKISFRPRYFLRLLFLLQGSVWSAIFSKLESMRYGKAIQASPLPDNPIFIIGHWRTGSTFLHNLLSLDSQFVTPTLLQTALPRSFISSKRYYAPVMQMAMRKQRPMDGVKLGVNEPMEDEYALLRLTACSPLEKLFFPDNKQYFLKDFEDFSPPENELSRWENVLKYFYRKLVFASGKTTLLIKNPFHSMRISLLVKNFPNARFIHIYRNPLKVIPSTIQMWSIVGRQNSFSPFRREPKVDETASVFAKIISKIEEGLQEVPLQNVFKVRFEDLEKNPVEKIKEIYRKFELPFMEDYQRKVQSFLQEQEDYNKNNYSLTETEQANLHKRLALYFQKYDYDVQ